MVITHKYTLYTGIADIVHRAIWCIDLVYFKRHTVRYDYAFDLDVSSQRK